MSFILLQAQPQFSFPPGNEINVADVERKFKLQRKFVDRRKDLYSARTYVYEGEEKCDQNRDVFLECIETTGNVCNLNSRKQNN